MCVCVCVCVFLSDFLPFCQSVNYYRLAYPITSWLPLLSLFFLFCLFFLFTCLSSFLFCCLWLFYLLVCNFFFFFVSFSFSHSFVSHFSSGIFFLPLLHFLPPAYLSMAYLLFLSCFILSLISICFPLLLFQSSMKI